MDRPSRFEARRIFGLDLSKKALKACFLDEETCFEKTHIFDERMNDEGRLRLARRFRKGDYVAMEGGSSTSFLARYLMEHTEAEVFVLNPCKLHIIFKSSCKTDKQDCIKIAGYIRDTHPSNWCLIPIPTYEETSLRSLMNGYISNGREWTRDVNQMHAVFNLNGISFLKRSDLKRSEKRHALVSRHFDDNGSIAGLQARLMLHGIDSIELHADAYDELVRKALLSRPRETLIWMSLPGIGPLTALSHRRGPVGYRPAPTLSERFCGYSGWYRPHRSGCGCGNGRRCKANRKRNIQMKFYVTEEEKRLIDGKMAQLPTRRYGAYLRKMAIDGYDKRRGLKRLFPQDHPAGGVGRTAVLHLPLRLCKERGAGLSLALDPLRAAVWDLAAAALDHTGRRLSGRRDRPVPSELRLCRPYRRLRPCLAAAGGGVVCAADAVPPADGRL